jgi:hypothetical protein
MPQPAPNLLRGYGMKRLLVQGRSTFRAILRTFYWQVFLLVFLILPALQDSTRIPDEVTEVLLGFERGETLHLDKIVVTLCAESESTVRKYKSILIIRSIKEFNCPQYLQVY